MDALDARMLLAGRAGSTIFTDSLVTPVYRLHLDSARLPRRRAAPLFVLARYVNKRLTHLILLPRAYS